MLWLFHKFATDVATVLSLETQSQQANSKQFMHWQEVPWIGAVMLFRLRMFPSCNNNCVFMVVTRKRLVSIAVSGFGNKRFRNWVGRTLQYVRLLQFSFTQIKTVYWRLNDKMKQYWNIGHFFYNISNLGSYHKFSYVSFLKLLKLRISDQVHLFFKGFLHTIAYR
jgi:hypothetical protein